MTTNEKVLEALGALGFKLKQVEDALYTFDYEGREYWYLPSGNELLLNIAIPGICEFDEENTLSCFELEDRLNATLEFVKVYKASGHLWLFYERELMGEEDIRLVLAQMIARLESAMYVSEKIMAAMEPEETENDEAVIVDEENEEKNNNDNMDYDKEE